MFIYRLLTIVTQSFLEFYHNYTVQQIRVVKSFTQTLAVQSLIQSVYFGE